MKMHSGLTNRISIHYHSGATEIRIKSVPNRLAVFFLILWLAAWIVGGFFAVYSLLTQRHEQAWFIMVWLVFWFAAVLIVLFQIMWFLFGYERVTIEDSQVSVGRYLFRPFLEKTYVKSETLHFLASGYFGENARNKASLIYWGHEGGTIVLESQNEKHRFGIQLSEEDSKNLVELLNELVAQRII
jgi:hypothetical protein